MAQILLQKIRFFITHDAVGDFVTRLHDEGIAHMIPEKPDQSLSVYAQENFEHRTWSARLESAVTFLMKYTKENDPLRPIFEGGKVITDISTINQLIHSHHTEDILGNVHRIQKRLVEISSEIKALSEEERTISAWKRLNFPLRSLSDTTSTVVLPVHGSARELDAIIETLSTEASVHAERVSENALLVIAHRTQSEFVKTIFHGREVEVLRLPNTEETPQQAVDRIIQTRTKLENEKKALETEAFVLAKAELSSLKQIADRAQWTETQIDTSATLPRSSSVAVFDAWVPEPTWKILEEKLATEFPTTAFQILDSAEDEARPTLIANRGFASPFEFVTRLYGVPGHTDIDPTPFLAVFFFIFFGLCLSDVGYGLVLMLLTGAALLRYKIIGGMRSLILTLFFGGLGATIVGFLYGGYFGISAIDIHPALASLQQFDPIGNPMPVFYLALAMGVMQIIFGIVLDIARAAKNNDFINGALDNVPWLLMFMVLIIFVISGTGVLPAALSAIIASTWHYGAIGAGVLISLTQARHGKNILDMALKGVLALYGGVNYFSDILSYSRLLALGLATSALGFSINLIAGIVGGNSLGIGTIFAILILIAGHTLNITLSTLGAFIHSSRLQYVEFFGKFLKNTGKPFTPYARKHKYTIILPKTPG